MERINTCDCNETVKSRFDDIRNDGPNINTSILEITDNSIDWGNSTMISITHDIRNIIIKDNGPNGFGSIDSMIRYFTLGEVNSQSGETTIGKYGKGGYKAAISIGHAVKVISYFDGKKHIFETDFLEMEKRNDFKFTSEPIIMDNETDEVGSEIIIQLRPEYANNFNGEFLEKTIKRSYHNKCVAKNGDEINISIHSDNGQKDILLGEEKTFGDYHVMKELTIYYDLNTNEFTDENRENCKEVGILRYYILKEMVTQNKLLGNHPGIDIYRNDRLCNARYPLRNIGNIGNYLSYGMMRGMRCHVTFHYTDKQLTDNKSMDNFIGLTTTKEICEEDDKIEPTLLKIIEGNCLECSKNYEDFIKGQKEQFKKNIEKMKNGVEKILVLSDSDLIENTFDLEGNRVGFQNFLEYKTYYFNQSTLKFNYCKSKKEATEMKKNGEGQRIRADNSIFIEVGEIITMIDEIIDKKKSIIQKEHRINVLMEEKNLSPEEAEEEYKREVSVQEFLDKINRYKEEGEEYLENEDYESALISFNKVIQFDSNNEEVNGFINHINCILDGIKDEKVDQVNTILEECRILCNEGDYDKILGMLEEALTIIPENEEVLTFIESVNQMKSESDRKELEQLISEGNESYNRKDYNSSNKLFRKILSIDPDLPDIKEKYEDGKEKVKESKVRNDEITNTLVTLTKTMTNEELIKLHEYIKGYQP